MASRRLLLLTITLTGCATMEEAEGPAAIMPEGARPNGIYSPAIAVDDLVFLSGQIGTRGPDGPIADVGGQTQQALRNIENILAAAGLGLAHVIKCSVFLTDIEQYGPMNEVYRGVWPGDPPARTTVAVAALPAGALVEIECWAYRPE